MIYSVIRSARLFRFKRYLINRHRRLYNMIMEAGLQKGLRNRFLSVLSGEPYRHILSKPPSRPDEKYDICFLTHNLTPDILKDIIALKRDRSRLKILVFTRNNNLVKSLSDKYIDKVIVWRYYVELALVLPDLKVATMVVVRRADTVGLIAAPVFFKGRIVYRPYPFAHREPDGIAPPDELKAEKFIIEHSNAIYHFFHERMAGILADLMKAPRDITQVLPSCLDELGTFDMANAVNSNNPIKIVYVGGLYKNGDLPKRFGYIKDIAVHFEKIVAQGMELYVYTPYICHGELADEILALKKYPGFHLEGMLDFTKLLRVISECDWGYYYQDLSCYPIRPGFEWFASNGFFTYLQAGLPVIVSSTVPAYKEIVEKFGIGISLDNGDFDTLKDRLGKLNLKEIKLRVARASRQTALNHKALQDLLVGQVSGAQES